MSRSTGIPPEAWLAFTFGVVFCSVLLYLGTAVVNPSPLTIRIYVTVLSLAAGGVGAVLPGFLEVRYKGAVRAGGAIGLAVLVYLFEPAIGSGVPKYETPTALAEPTVMTFLTALDTGNPRDSWMQLGELARRQLDDREQTWTELYKNNLTPLGSLQTRSLVGETKVESPPGVAPGIYETFTFKSKRMTDAGFRLESVTVRANQERRWEIYSYTISPTVSPG